MVSGTQGPRELQEKFASLCRIPVEQSSGARSTDISADQTCTLRLASQAYSFGFNRFRTAFLQLSSGNWSNLPQQALDGSTFHAWAELQLTSDWPDAGTRVVIEQVGQPTTPSLSFRVWMLLSNVAGTGHYTATPISTDTWTHSVPRPTHQPGALSLCTL